MNPRPVDRLLRCQPLVEDAGADGDERGPEPGAARRADRKREPVRVERERRRHHALHPLTRLERAHEQVLFAEHAVQMQVETREEVTGAEAEARRQDNGAAPRVDGHEVRRVPVPVTPRERRREREHTLRLRNPGKPRQTT